MWDWIGLRLCEFQGLGALGLWGLCSGFAQQLLEDFRAVWQLTSMSLGVGLFAIPLGPQSRRGGGSGLGLFGVSRCLGLLGV